MSEHSDDQLNGGIKKPSNQDGEGEASLSSKAGEYVKALLAEKLLIDHSKFPNVVRLLDEEVSRVQAIGRIPQRDVKYVNIYREKPIKVVVKALVPVKEHPKFNFVGKILGPKGNSMRRLQEETMCKMSILGRGSIRDKAKEEELRNSLDPKYSHLSDDLHVEISALGPPSEAHARIAFALAELRKYLIPDSNDNIILEQMREMDIMTSERETESSGREGPGSRSRPHGPHIPRGGPPIRRPNARPPVVASRGPLDKPKIMSILDRARIAMEESYGYNDEPYTSGYRDDYDYDVDYSRDPYKSGASNFELSSHKGFKPSSAGYFKSSAIVRPDVSRYRASPYSRPMK